MRLGVGAGRRKGKGGEKETFPLFGWWKWKGGKGNRRIFFLPKSTIPFPGKGERVRQNL
jgi:hypothetical protein